MLMLEDLKKRQNLMQILNKSIKNNGYQAIISLEKLCIDRSIEKNKQYETLFDNSDLAFAGVSHGNIIGALFALDVRKDQQATLKEYLTIPRSANGVVDQKLIKEELTGLAIVVSIFYPEILKIKLPAGIDEFSNEECEVKKSFNVCFLNILKH